MHAGKCLNLIAVIQVTTSVACGIPWWRKNSQQVRGTAATIERTDRLVRLPFLRPLLLSSLIATDLISTTSPPVSYPFSVKGCDPGNSMLASLPTEVLLHIASFLDRPSLAFLLRVNSSFCSTLRPSLYSSINAISLGAPALHPPLSNPVYSKHVRHLTIRPHSHEHCEVRPEHEILHLRSVRLHMKPAITHPEWQLHTVLAPYSNLVPEPKCRLSRNVRAERLVVAETFMDGDNVEGLQDWIKEVEDVVLFLSPEQGRLTTGERRRRSRYPMEEMDLARMLGHLPQGMRRLTVVLRHPTLSEREKLASLEEFARDLLKTPRELVRGIVDVFDDLDEMDIISLESLTIVLPEGVLSTECRDHLLQTIRLDPQVERTKVRVLSMLGCLAHPSYQGVMTEEQKRTWWERSSLAHYEILSLLRASGFSHLPSSPSLPPAFRLPRPVVVIP